MATATQEHRQLAMTTPLGKDVLLLTAFCGREEISRLFHFHLEMLSADHEIKAEDIVGKDVTFSVRTMEGEPRFFNGVVSKFSAGSVEHDFRVYRAEVVPSFWLLTRTADCRIFQNKSVVEIIEQVFGDLGLADFETSGITGSHPKHEYCVQYRETDFNFASRLMEHEGIFYYFRHEDGKNVMVLADQKGVHQWCPEKEVEVEHTLAAQKRFDRITSWEHQFAYRPGKWAHTDYNFTTPSASLMTDTKTVVKFTSADKYEVYDFPGCYGLKGDGTSLVRIRMEEEEAPHDVVAGTSTCKTFTPGGKFTVKDHYAANEEGKSYVITSIEHWATEPSSYGNTGGSGEEYSNRFSCIPVGTTFRPERSTPKPMVQGPQTAVVVGPGGEEIYPDQYGRVKVQFHWDREGKKDENSSCWIRVSQAWAGAGWGAMIIPRIGQEVIVDFLEGDPDQPIITGRVYNAEQTVPYELPANKTISTIKTRSSMGGGAANFNEIRFEDMKGSEQLFIHAEKNQDIEVENDETHWVGHDRTKTIDNDETTHVKHDRTETVDNNETITIGNDRTETVHANEIITVMMDRTRTVQKNETITVALMRTHSVGINEAITVGAAQEVTVGGMQTVTVGLNQTNSIGKDQSTSVGKNQTNKVGDNRTTDVGKNDSLTVGKNLTIEAGDQVLIKTGKASILMKKDGTITIDGKDITITGSGKITEEAKKDMILKGKKILQN